MVPDEDISAMRTQPSWPALVANAHTITREVRAAAACATFDPSRQPNITVPSLLLTGAQSRLSRADIDVVAAALPDARVQVLEDQQHIAHVLIPETFAELVIAFLHDRHQ